jgi:hypothetical protein
MCVNAMSIRTNVFIEICKYNVYLIRTNVKVYRYVKDNTFESTPPYISFTCKHFHLLDHLLLKTITKFIQNQFWGVAHKGQTKPVQPAKNI